MEQHLPGMPAALVYQTGVGGGEGEGVERGQRGGAGATRREKTIFSSVF